MIRALRRPSRWLAYLIALGAFPSVRAGDGDDLRARVDALAKPYIESGTAAGMAVGMVRGEESWLLGYGKVRDRGDETPDADTIFEIGSISKVFTGLMLADLAERRLVKLDEPVQDLLPAGVTVPRKGDRAITLLDLATHTSGLPRLMDNLTPKDAANPYADYTVEQLYACLEGYKLPRVPGSEAEYSNFGMGLLGHALALRAGESYEGLLRDRICGPLRMTETSTSISEDRARRFAQGHDATGAPTPHWDLPAVAGAGGIRSTARDLLTFLRANLDPEATPIAGAIRASHVPRFDGKEHRSAMAWAIAKDGKSLWHNGATGGFSSIALFDEGRRIGAVVLSNSVSEGAIDQLGFQLMRLLAGQEVAPPTLHPGPLLRLRTFLRRRDARPAPSGG